MREEAHAVVIELFGLPGSGKSYTVEQLVQRNLPPGISVENSATPAYLNRNARLRDLTIDVAIPFVLAAGGSLLTRIERAARVSRAFQAIDDDLTRKESVVVWEEGPFHWTLMTRWPQGIPLSLVNALEAYYSARDVLLVEVATDEQSRLSRLVQRRAGKPKWKPKSPMTLLTRLSRATNRQAGYSKSSPREGWSESARPVIQRFAGYGLSSQVASFDELVHTMKSYLGETEFK